ncbi:hypothetical protein THOM_0814 [Trachipleistophora hominis]|uniref:Uncharacterized protein n=1 Tax=Trachipleistophora hominis TaxID=72359 RepID=L7JXM7_TRAHO|nr:hypothetical protein THOM_0814 [Trachipleistophora hominis]
MNDMPGRKWNYPADMCMGTNEFLFTRFFNGDFSIRGDSNGLNFFD